CDNGSKEDIFVWYKDMIEIGAFEGELNSDQQELKNLVENIIKSPQKSQRLFDKEKLLAYESILNLNEETNVNDGNDDDDTEVNEDETESINDEIELKESPEAIKNLPNKKNTSLKHINLESSKNKIDFKLGKKLMNNKNDKTFNQKENENLYKNRTEMNLKNKSKKKQSRMIKTSIKNSYNTINHLGVFQIEKKFYHELKQKYKKNTSLRPNCFFKLLNKIWLNKMSPPLYTCKIRKVVKKTNRYKGKYRPKNNTLKVCLSSLNYFKVCQYFFNFRMCIPGFCVVKKNSTKSVCHSDSRKAFTKEKTAKNNIVQDKLRKYKTANKKWVSDKRVRPKINYIKNKTKVNSDLANNDPVNNMVNETNVSSKSLENKTKKFHSEEKRHITTQEFIQETSTDKPLNKDLREENSLDISKVKEVINEKSNEYLNKMQSLEISIITLEKQFLVAQLNKTNDLLSVLHLKSQILHLENEFMKLNQTYTKLQHDNDELKLVQQKYFEIKQNDVKLLNTNLQMNLIQNQSKIIKQQQTKLTELSYLINNQSNFLMKLSQGQEDIEEKNRILHQIVMNQSLLISQVMESVNILTNHVLQSHRRENTNKLKMSPLHLIDKLEHLISNKNIDEKRINIHCKKAETRSWPSRNPRVPVGEYSHHIGINLSKLKHWYLACLSKTCFIFENRNEKYMPSLPESLRANKSSIKVHSGTNNDSEQRNISTNIKDKTLSQNKLLNELKPQQIKIKESNKIIHKKIKIKNERIDKKKEKNIGGKKVNQNSNSVNQQQNSDKILPKESLHKKQQSSGDISDQKTTKSPIKKLTDKEATNIKDSNNKNQSVKEPIYVDSSHKEPKDCYDLYIKGNTKNGAYKIKPIATKKTLEVFCDMRNGGWTLIQRRQGGSINFYRDWNSYKKGFGGIYGEHWLGNDNIHWLTNQGKYSLRVDLIDWQKSKVTALYEYFMVEDDSNGYRLHVEGYSGDSGDSLSKHNLSKFSTRDVDNDLVVKQFGGSCAKRFTGAWWYFKCYASNLNGVFYRNGVVAEKKFDGIAWKAWKKANYSLMKTEMKIKPIIKTKMQ
ncbi:angiopoietin-4-like, partial [Argonauta hians]